MQIFKTLATAAVIISFSTATAFAAPGITAREKRITIPESRIQSERISRHVSGDFERDPVKALENKKLKIQSLLKEGKLTKEEADKYISRIDEKIKEIKSFNKLSLKQKREKLIQDCKERVEKQVSEGKLDRAKADEIIKKYTEKINSWDGSGYPSYHPEKVMRKHKDLKPEKD